MFKQPFVPYDHGLKPQALYILTTALRGSVTAARLLLGC